MNYRMFVLIVVICAVVFLLCRKDKTISHYGYEIEDLAFDTCQKRCLEQGHSHDLCSDRNKLTGCISEMVGVSDPPPPGTTFAFPE